MKGVVRASSDSEIKFAVWLRLAGWNWKYRQEGNGEFAGIAYRSTIDPWRREKLQGPTNLRKNGARISFYWRQGVTPTTIRERLTQDLQVFSGHYAVGSLGKTANADLAAAPGRPA